MFWCSREITTSPRRTASSGPGSEKHPVIAPLFSTERRPSICATTDRSAAVYPAPCAARRSSVNNVGWINPAVRIAEVEHHIGIAHGSLLGLSPDPDMQYYPMAPEYLQKLPVDLWLLGHTHIRYPAVPRKGDRIFNPGTPEPDGFDCDHAGAAFVLDLEPGSPPSVKTVATGRYRFADRELTITPETKPADIPGMISDDLGAEVLLRVALKGSVSAESRSALSQLESDSARPHLLPEYGLRGMREAITPERITREFPDDSFARRLLTKVLETGDETALDIAFDLIEEARGDH